MDTVNGLPAHVLLVHAVVVLVPLTALVVLLVAVWPAARRRLAVAGGVLAVVTLIAVPLTTQAGEWLEHRLPSTPLLRAHTGLGDDLLPWVIGLTVVGLALAAREVLAGRAREVRAEGPGAAVATHAARSSSSAPGGPAVTIVLAVLAVVVAIGSVTTTYEIGDSGARAAWTGKFSPTPLPRPPRPAGEG